MGIGLPKGSYNQLTFTNQPNSYVATATASNFLIVASFVLYAVKINSVTKACMILFCHITEYGIPILKPYLMQHQRITLV
ncbi:hypothetical protein KIN20_006992 [Parelaphostrongylus tenuis]|uniref:Uncharacterized protein n=1 Tax=Parelaphostrongylus tenuis TaxID=148309 RepID=A0AAD5QJP3_PARTN|nr:hypothetical protein KIN20_006992 [Parelaphostrongylus tenuis]